MGLSRGLADPVARMNGRKAECGGVGRYATMTQSNATRPDPQSAALLAGYELRATND